MRELSYIVVVLRFDKKLPSNPNDGLFAEASFCLWVKLIRWILHSYLSPTVTLCLSVGCVKETTMQLKLKRRVKSFLDRYITAQFIWTQHTDLGQCMKSMKITTKREKRNDNGEGKKEIGCFLLWFYFTFKIVFPRPAIHNTDKESESFSERRPSLGNGDDVNGPFKCKDVWPVAAWQENWVELQAQIAGTLGTDNHRELWMLGSEVNISECTWQSAVTFTDVLNVTLPQL